MFEYLFDVLEPTGEQCRVSILASDLSDAENKISDMGFDAAWFAGMR